MVFFSVLLVPQVTNIFFNWLQSGCEGDFKQCSKECSRRTPSALPLKLLTSGLVPTGYVQGGHVMRLFHGHDESMTIPGAEKTEDQQRWVSIAKFTQRLRLIPVIAWEAKEFGTI